MLLARLGHALLGNLSTGKGEISASKATIRPGQNF